MINELISENLKNKEYLSITEVFQLTSINAHILRYWEKNGLITPLKVHNGQRRYSSEHIKQLFRIKKLLYEDKISIKGVKKILSGKKDKTLEATNKEHFLILDDIKKEIKSILKLLK